MGEDSIHNRTAAYHHTRIQLRYFTTPSTPPDLQESPCVLQGLMMHRQTNIRQTPPKKEENGEAEVTASAKALVNPSSEAFGAQSALACATVTPDTCGTCGFFCQSWCLPLALTLLLLFLLGSWAVVHLTLGTHGGSPFRVSASYDQRIPQEDTATIEPYFTTNCTMGK